MLVYSFANPLPYNTDAADLQRTGRFKVTYDNQLAWEIQEPVSPNYFAAVTALQLIADDFYPGRNTFSVCDSGVNFSVEEDYVYVTFLIVTGEYVINHADIPALIAHLVDAYTEYHELPTATRIAQSADFIANPPDGYFNLDDYAFDREENLHYFQAEQHFLATTIASLTAS